MDTVGEWRRMKERLQKLIASAGLCARRTAEEWIAAGRVRVNGEVAVIGGRADPETDTVTVDGRPLPQTAAPVYLMLNKPRGYVTTLSDECGRQTAAELVAGCGARVYPVGRLDRDSEGLLLFTNDGQLAHRLLSPKSHVDKVYYARVDGALEPGDIAAFAAGMTLGDGLECLPAGLEILSPTEALVTLREGKFHQVKRMLAARGKPVLYLKRLSMGRLRLDPALAPGAWRMLTEEERSALNLSLSETLLDRTTKNEERIL